MAYWFCRALSTKRGYLQGSGGRRGFLRACGNRSAPDLVALLPSGHRAVVQNLWKRLPRARIHLGNVCRIPLWLGDDGVTSTQRIRLIGLQVGMAKNMDSL